MQTSRQSPWPCRPRAAPRRVRSSRRRTGSRRSRSAAWRCCSCTRTRASRARPC